jgi:hypothetical protein
MGVNEIDHTRAWIGSDASSQGVALGYFVPAFQAEEMSELGSIFG